MHTLLGTTHRSSSPSGSESSTQVLELDTSPKGMSLSEFMQLETVIFYTSGACVLWSHVICACSDKSMSLHKIRPISHLEVEISEYWNKIYSSVTSKYPEVCQGGATYAQWKYETTVITIGNWAWGYYKSGCQFSMTLVGWQLVSIL